MGVSLLDCCLLLCFSNFGSGWGPWEKGGQQAAQGPAALSMARESRTASEQAAAAKPSFPSQPAMTA